jgi:hypothetical protein
MWYSIMSLVREAVARYQFEPPVACYGADAPLPPGGPRLQPRSAVTSVNTSR